MAKRMLTLALALALTLCVTTVLASGIGTAAYSGSGPEPVVPATTMYVCTDNGLGLNVRSAPYVGNNIIGVASYGAEVKVIRFLDNGWACIQWGKGEGYVQSRFLLSYKPAARVTATPVPVYTVAPYTSYEEYSYDYTDTLAVLNAEFRTARLVTPFTVVVRPARASGWVNMRWAPSKTAKIRTTRYNGDTLRVIAENKTWAQVMDDTTGECGFMMKRFLEKVEIGG